MLDELGVSCVTIDYHIKKMESSGVITGYTVTLGAEEFRYIVSGWILINVSAKEEEDIISQMIVMPEISRLLPQTGGGTSRPKSRHQHSKPFMSRSRGCGRSRVSGKPILACCGARASADPATAIPARIFQRDNSPRPHPATGPATLAIWTFPSGKMVFI